MKFRLYHYWRSTCSWRVRWALAFKEIPCDFIPVNLLNDETEHPDYLKKNPMGYVPTLEILSTEGSHSPSLFLSESVAIIEYLEETVPTPSLLLRDPFQRAKVRQLAETINSGTQPLQNLNVFQRHSSDPNEQKAWNQTWIQKGLASYEAQIQSTARKFSVGDTFTLADIFLIPQCYNAMRFDLELSQFPVIERIYKNVIQTQAYKMSEPERYKPA